MATKEECAMIRWPKPGFTVIRKTALDDKYLQENNLTYVGVNSHGMDEYHHADFAKYLEENPDGCAT